MSNMRSTQVLPDPHLRAIGMVTVEWAWLEYLLHSLIWALADIEKPGRGNAITDHMRAGQLSFALQSLALDRFGETSQEFTDIKDISKHIRRLYDKRNIYAHAHWEPAKVPGTAQRLNRRHQQRLSADYDDVDAEEIELVAQEISVLAAKIHDTLQAHYPDAWTNI